MYIYMIQLILKIPIAVFNTNIHRILHMKLIIVYHDGKEHTGQGRCRFTLLGHRMPVIKHDISNTAHKDG
jgi:hypothetical protein